MQTELMAHPGTHYRVQIQRDEDCTNPLDDDSGVISYVYEDWSYSRISGEAALIKALLPSGDFEDYVEGRQSYYSYLYDIADLNPLCLDWQCVAEYHPDVLEDPTDATAGEQDNIKLLEWAGLPVTDDNVFTDDIPAGLVTAMYTWLSETKYVFDSFTADDDRQGQYIVWAERAKIQEVWGTFSENVEASFKSTVKTAQAWASGCNYGFIITKVIAADDDDTPNCDLDEVWDTPHSVFHDSCWGFTAEHTKPLLEGYMNGHWPDEYRQVVTDALLQELGKWAGECDILVPIP